MILSFILTDSYIITTHPQSNCGFITVIISWLFREAVPQNGNVCTPWVMKGFPCGSAGKESVCNVGDLGWEDPLEKGKATHSSILAWRIPWGRKELDATEQLSLSPALQVDSLPTESPGNLSVRIK